MHIHSPDMKHEQFMKHFQGYFDIFWDSDAYSVIVTRAQLGDRRGKASPALFENRRKCFDFGRKRPDCVHLLVKFSI